jgi:hypothetical protein
MARKLTIAGFGIGGKNVARYWLLVARLKTGNEGNNFSCFALPLSVMERKRRGKK